MKITLMKAMNKKIISSVLVICVALCAAAGCSKKTDGSLSSAASDSTSAAVTEAEVQASSDSQESTKPTELYSDKAVEPVLKLSGDANDIITVESNSYYEGDRFVLFFEKGVTVDGAIADKVKQAMNDNEKVLGLSYDEYGYAEPTNWRGELFGGAFTGINEDMKKVNVLVMKDPKDGSIEWADSDCVLLFDTDFDLRNNVFDTVYHELAHALRLRNGSNLGQIIEEGVALYAEDRVSRLQKYPDWSIIQYVNYGGYQSTYDDKDLIADPEGYFTTINNEERSAAQNHYQYGIRFITFLYDEYGNDVLKTITENSHKYTYRYNDTETIVKIIKESTSEDVFDRFRKWLPEGWKAFGKDYVEYIEGSIVE